MKKKLTLKIDELHVEQFQVEQARDAARGTVRGHSDLNCGTYTCECASHGYTAPCRYCFPVLITYSCDGGECT